MKNNLLFILSMLFLITLVTSNKAMATHVRGGEITLKRESDNSLTYGITMTTYTDYVDGIGANNTQNDVDITIYSNGAFVASFKMDRIDRFRIGNDTEKNVYFKSYTFRAPGIYSIGGLVRNRNKGVENMAKSEDTSFLVETTLVINTELGLNGTPILLNPAVDFNAIIGQRFIHNSNAFDAEGDSLAYRLTIPKQLKGDGNVITSLSNIIPVTEYIDPSLVKSATSMLPGRTEDGKKASFFRIDSLNGDVYWDSPAKIGEYNIAFEILEYRNGVLISKTVRDMQIVVKEGNNTRPFLDIPNELCIQAGEKVSVKISATDQEKHPLLFSSTGPVYRFPDNNPKTNLLPQILAPFATFTAPEKPKAEPTSATFEWQTSCDHIRQKPYEILFKVQDFPSSNEPGLTESKIWRIRIVAPAVGGLVAKPVGSGAVKLSWAKYNCGLTGSLIEVYRKIGCTEFTPNACFGGLPATLGYTKVGETHIDSTSYIDKGLGSNTLYSYRLVVKFAEATGGGIGVASKEVCLDVPLQMPVITNVSIDKTSKTEGEISVKWTRPLGFLPNEASGPFQYKLYRQEDKSSFSLINTISTDFNLTKADTLITDKNLNTENKVYVYKLELWYTKNGVLTAFDASLPAASVKLATLPANKAVVLNWVADVPWSNENQKHTVFREVRTKPGVFNKIAEVTVKAASSFTFTDTGADTAVEDGNTTITLSVDSIYCYKVETIGTYNNARIQPNLLSNFSQIICGFPKDNIKPCPLSKITVVGPDCEALKNVSCEITKYENTINWSQGSTPNPGTICDQTVRGYNIYYARYDGDPFTKIATVDLASTTSYTHKGLTSYAGCYYVTAINKFGNESDPQNKVCIDNCDSFLSFPNVITPNGDNKNDDFQPLYCARFIKTVEYVVVNRNGNEVYRGTSTDPKIRWAAVDNSVTPLPDGIYYYEATVTFDRLNKNAPTQKVKGWVEVIR